VLAPVGHGQAELDAGGEGELGQLHAGQRAVGRGPLELALIRHPLAGQRRGLLDHVTDRALGLQMRARHLRGDGSGHVAVDARHRGVHVRDACVTLVLGGDLRQPHRVEHVQYGGLAVGLDLGQPVEVARTRRRLEEQVHRYRCQDGGDGAGGGEDALTEQPAVPGGERAGQDADDDRSAEPTSVAGGRTAALESSVGSAPSLPGQADHQCLVGDTERVAELGPLIGGDGV
jgi:hypothetical protein